MSTFLILHFVTGLLIAIIFALLEIQIEGKDGWAKALPTWKKYLRWFQFFAGKKKLLTGYHLYLWIFIFLLIHTPLLHTPFSWGLELILLSRYFMVLQLEDIIWFILNPHFGLRKFKSIHIPWHNEWILFLPMQHITFTIVWIILLHYGLKLYF